MERARVGFERRRDRAEGEAASFASDLLEVLVQGAAEPARLMCGPEADEVDVPDRLRSRDEPEEVGDDLVAGSDHERRVAELVDEERVVVGPRPLGRTAGRPEVGEIVKDLQEVLVRRVLDHAPERSEAIPNHGAKTRHDSLRT